MTDTTPSAPMAQTSGGLMDRIDTFLDKYILPFPVKYLTNRITILATLCLLIPLLILADNAKFEFGANSYLNVMSVVVSSTVLLYSTLAEARDRAASERREQIAAEHQKMLEERAEADHQRIEEIHQHLNDLSTEVTQHVTASLENIQKILIDHLEKLQDEDHVHIETMNKAVMASIAAHREELVDLRELLNTMQGQKGGSQPAA